MGLAPYFCMTFWLLPQTIYAIKNIEPIEKPIDPKWRQYIKEMSDTIFSTDLPSPPTARTTETIDIHHPRVQMDGWSTLGFSEAPYLAVIYSQQAHNNIETLDFYKPGAACGAAIVAEDKLVTLCACVASWWMFYGTGVWDIDETQYKLSDHNIKSKYLQVAHSKDSFEPTSRTSPILGDKEVINKQPRCTKMLVDRKNVIEQHAILVVLLFHFPITNPHPGQYIPWPPAPILYDAPDESPANLISFGMRSLAWPPKRFYNNDGEYFLNITAVSFKLRKMGVEHCANRFSDMSKEIQERSTCFLAMTPSFKPHELCGGLIGSPIIASSNIVGLLATAVDCDNEIGSAVVLDFVRPIRELIENFVGSTLLTEQQRFVHARLWREKEIPKGFVAYEDAFISASISPLSLGDIFTPSPALIITLIAATHFNSILRT